MIYLKALLAIFFISISLGLERSGWLDRVVQFYKTDFFKQLADFSRSQITAEIRRKPADFVDSKKWDYDSVLRLLTLIRHSENAKPARRALRHMLQPTRRIMMSMKESMVHFPSLTKNEKNHFYYDVEYTSDEESVPPPPPLPEDEVVVVVSNPVEARLPSARISVKLLREILEARARAARQLPSTTAYTIPWKPMNKTLPNTGGDGEVDANGDKDDDDKPTDVVTVVTTTTEGPQGT